MRNAAALFLLMVASCQTAHPSPAAHGHFSASIAGSTLSVLADGKSGSLDLKSQLAGAFVAESQVIFSARTDRGVFFVIHFVSASRANDHNGECGAGVEENLVWVAFDRSLHPLNVTSSLIVSCWQNIDDPPGVRQNARSISVRYDSYNEKVRRFLFFRKAAPELGFAIQESPLPDSGVDDSQQRN